ncbi:MAG: PilZ domain-containing protein [Myxococcota bacterium]
MFGKHSILDSFNHDDFDIDVDLADILGTDEPLMVDDRWYRLAEWHQERSAPLQRKIDKMLRNQILYAQWRATQRRSLDRRCAIRAPLVSRVHIDSGAHLVATNISLSGLRCAGEPTAPVMDVEFKIPGLPFPIDARTEVVSFKASSVAPLIGLRFVDLDRPYRHHIAEYIHRRRDRQLVAHKQAA